MIVLGRCQNKRVFDFAEYPFVLGVGEYALQLQKFDFAVG